MPGQTPTSSSPIQAEINQPYWVGKTKKCQVCLENSSLPVFSIHASNCLSERVMDSLSAQESPPEKLKTISEFTLDDRLLQLNKFEVLMFTPTQVKEFNEKFTEKKVVQDESLFNIYHSSCLLFLLRLNLSGGCWLTKLFLMFPRKNNLESKTSQLKKIDLIPHLQHG